MMGLKERAFGPLPPLTLEDLVPLDHFYRHLERSLDLIFVRDLVRDRYAPGERPVGEPLDSAQGVVGGDVGVEVDEGEHAQLRVLPATHREPPPALGLQGHRTMPPLRYGASRPATAVSSAAPVPGARRLRGWGPEGRCGRGRSGYPSTSR